MSSAFGLSIEPFHTKSLKRSKSSELEGFVNVSLSSDASAYLYPSLLKGAAESHLLPTDRKRWLKLGQSKLLNGAWPISFRYDMFVTYDVEIFVKC